MEALRRQTAIDGEDLPRTSIGERYGSHTVWCLHLQRCRRRRCDEDNGNEDDGAHHYSLGRATEAERTTDARVLLVRREFEPNWPIISRLLDEGCNVLLHM